MTIAITKDNSEITVDNVSTTQKNVYRTIGQSAAYNLYVKPAKAITLTVGGTFEVGDVFTATLAGTPFAHTVVGGDTDNSGIATALAAVIDASADYTATSSAAVITVTAVDPFNDFSVATTAVNGGATDDQTLVAATLTPSITLTPKIINKSQKTANEQNFFLPTVSGGANTVTKEFYTLETIFPFVIPLEVGLVQETLTIEVVGAIYDNIWVNIEPDFYNINIVKDQASLARRAL